MSTRTISTVSGLRERCFALSVAAVTLLAWCSPVMASEHESYSLKNDLSLWSLIVFGGFVWLVRKFVWDAVIGTPMEVREAREKTLVKEAMTAHEQAQVAWKTHQGKMAAFDENVKVIMAEADRDASHTKAEIHALADKETQVINHRATVEIERARDQALHQVFETAADQITAKTTQSLKTLGANDQQRLIAESLAVLQRRTA